MSWDCPKCAAPAKCVDSRRRIGPFVYRRMECTACPCRFSSAEILVLIDDEPAPPLKRWGTGAPSMVDQLETNAFQRHRL